MPLQLKAKLISKSNARLSDVRFNGTQGKLMAKGIELAIAAIRTAEEPKHRLTYLAMLTKLLETEKSKIGASAEDERECMLAGLQTVIGLVEEEAKRVDNSKG